MPNSKRKIRLNQDPISSGEIAKGKEFDKILADYNTGSLGEESGNKFASLSKLGVIKVILVAAIIGGTGFVARLFVKKVAEKNEQKMAVKQEIRDQPSRSKNKTLGKKVFQNKLSTNLRERLKHSSASTIGFNKSKISVKGEVESLGFDTYSYSSSNSDFDFETAVAMNDRDGKMQAEYNVLSLTALQEAGVIKIKSTGNADVEKKHIPIAIAINEQSSRSIDPQEKSKKQTSKGGNDKKKGSSTNTSRRKAGKNNFSLNGSHRKTKSNSSELQGTNRRTKDSHFTHKGTNRKTNKGALNIQGSNRKESSEHNNNTFATLLAFRNTLQMNQDKGAFSLKNSSLNTLNAQGGEKRNMAKPVQKLDKTFLLSYPRSRFEVGMKTTLWTMSRLTPVYWAIPHNRSFGKDFQNYYATRTTSNPRVDEPGYTRFFTVRGDLPADQVLYQDSSNFTYWELGEVFSSSVGPKVSLRIVSNLYLESSFLVTERRLQEKWLDGVTTLPLNRNKGGAGIKFGTIDIQTGFRYWLGKKNFQVGVVGGIILSKEFFKNRIWRGNAEFERFPTQAILDPLKPFGGVSAKYRWKNYSLEVDVDFVGQDMFWSHPTLYSIGFNYHLY